LDGNVKQQQMQKPILNDALIAKAKKIKLLLTDVDGVLTDNGVYYAENGEAQKRFSIRDGMGVERLKNLCAIETGIITGEGSASVRKRAEKLNITLLFQSIKDKKAKVEQLMDERRIKKEEIAYIGDDTNDLEVMAMVGLRACPADAMFMVQDVVDYTCKEKGGYGAFREFVELIITARS
jgi:3-deoxy-D-manno-octulosonate 8-phosphate phosphatase (KDO 8-P phosphatase)